MSNSKVRLKLNILVKMEVLWWQKEGRLHGSGPFVLEIQSNRAAALLDTRHRPTT